jgi:hypothetical protein
MACIVNVPSSVDIIYGRSVSRAEPKLEELPFLPRVIDRLAVAAAELRRFLARVHFAHETVPDLMAGALYHPTDVFELAKARYERVWMPLLATQIPSGARLAAPLDVQWVHHLHRLDPDAYRADCERGFGRLIDPADPFLVAGDGVPAEDPVAEASARVAWSAIAPGWPFDLGDALRDFRQRGRLFPDGCRVSFDSSSSDMVGSAARQGGFLYQVLPAHYCDAAFIRHACERYAMLVAMWRDCPGEFLVPTYDMDLVWHAHLSTPLAYAAEMLEVVGRVVDHDDSVNDRAPGAKLDVRGARTRELWRRKYDNRESYVKNGAMWRGDPPDWYWTCKFSHPVVFGAPGPVVESLVVETGLSSAARYGEAEVVRELLKAANVDVNKANDDGDTPLIYAARNGHAEVVRELLKAANVDVNKANNDGDTPLIYAARNGHAEVVRELLKAANVDVKKANNDGDTPLTCALQYSAVLARMDGDIRYSPVFRLMKAGAVHVDLVSTRITRTARFQTMTFLNKFLHVSPEWVDCAFFPMLFLLYLVGGAAVFVVVVFKEPKHAGFWIAGFILSFICFCICTDVKNACHGCLHPDIINYYQRRGRLTDQTETDEEGHQTWRIHVLWTFFLALGLTPVFALVVFNDNRPGAWIGSAFLSLTLSLIGTGVILGCLGFKFPESENSGSGSSSGGGGGGGGGGAMCGGAGCGGGCGG